MKRFLSVLAVAAVMLLGNVGFTYAYTINADLSSVGSTLYIESPASTPTWYYGYKVLSMPSSSAPGRLELTELWVRNIASPTVYCYIVDKSGRKFVVTSFGAECTNVTFAGYKSQYAGITQLLLNYENSAPSGMEITIGNKAFSGCTKLQEFRFNGVAGLSYSLHEVKAEAFSGCSALATFSAKFNSNSIIGSRAFYNCSSLTSLTVGGSIEYDAFEGCTGVKSITWLGGSTTIDYAGRSPFYPMRSSVTTVELNDAVPDYMFYGFEALTGVNTPANIWDKLQNPDNNKMGIGKEAFYNCKKLASVSVAGYIDPSAFSGCSALTSVTYRGAYLAQSQVPTGAGKSFFYGCRDYVTSFKIESSSTKNIPNSFVPAYLCYGMKKLTEVSFPDYVGIIGMDAFGGCTALTKVSFNKNTSTCSLIGDDAFNGCTSLSVIALPNALETIGDNAFMDCKALRSFPISADNDANLKSIGASAFYGTGIESAYIPAKVNSIGSYAFSACYNLATLNWFATDYTEANPFTDNDTRKRLTTIIIGDGVTTLPEKFAYNSAITELYFPNSLEVIGSQAFAGAVSLKTITIGKTVPVIASNTFESTNVETIYAGCSVAAKIKADANWKAVCSNIQSADAKYTDSYLDNKTGHNKIGDYEYWQWTFNGKIEIVNPLDCDGKVTLRCVPEDGYTFAYWRDNGSTENPRTFDLATYDLWYLGGLCVNNSSYYQTNFTVSPEGAGYLNITNQYGHNRNNQKFIVGSENETAYLTPMEGNGWYRFDKWEYNEMYSNSPYELYDNPGTYELNLMLMPGMGYEDPETHEWFEGDPTPEFDPDMKALFVLKDIPVSFVSCTDGNGTVDRIGDELKVGSQIALMAKPYEGYIFDKWADGNTEATRLLTITPELLTERRPMGMDPELGEMTYNESPVDMGGGSLETYSPESEYSLMLCAYFKVDPNVNKTYTVHAYSNDDSWGTVTGGGEYKEGEIAYITATANPGYKFSMWSNGETVNPNKIKVTEDIDIMAIFVQDGDGPIIDDSYVCDFTTIATKHQTYADAWVYDEKWEVFGAANNNGAWAYAKFGGKKTNLEQANPVYVVNNSAFEKEIKQVRVTYPAGSFGREGMGINSWGVKVYSDPSCSQLLYTVEGGEFGNDAAVLTVSAKDGEPWSAGYGIQVYWDLVNTTTYNGIVWVEKVEYLTEAGNDDAYYVVMGLSSDPQAGDVMGSGTYKEGEVAKLEAFANEGYKFVRWDDGNTDNPRLVTVTSDLTFTAEFVKINDALFNVEGSNDGVQKVLRSGRIYILRNGEIFTTDGQRVR